MKDIIKLSLFHIRASNFQYYIWRWLPVAISIGIISGLIMSIFMWVIQTMLSLSNTEWAPLTIILAGSFTALLSKLGYKEVEGAGISYIVEKKNKREPIELRALGTKFASSSISLGSRMPGGREGPAMVIGGAFGYLIGKHILKLNDDDLGLAITIGSGACTAAVFHAPLGGTIFAAEVPYKRDVDSDIYIPAFAASVIAVLFFEFFGRGILGIKPFLLAINSQTLELSISSVLLVAILGSLIGLFGLVYCYAFTRLTRFLHSKGEAWIHIFLSALIVGVLVFVGTAIFHDVPIAEAGFDLLQWITINKDSLILGTVIGIFIIKMLIILICISGGNSVGIFGPSLVLGALVGVFFSIITNQTAYLSSFIIIGMASMQAATAKTPISAMVLIIELTSASSLILYMAIATILAYIISGDWSLYSQQLTYKKQAIKQQLELKDFLTMIPIKTIMTTNVYTLYSGMTLNEANELFHNTHVHTMPVVEPTTKKLLGIVSHRELRQQNLVNEKRIEEIMIRKVITLNINQTLRDGLEKFIELELERFPVVDNNSILQGFVTLHDMLTAYNKQNKVERTLEKLSI